MKVAIVFDRVRGSHVIRAARSVFARVRPIGVPPIDCNALRAAMTIGEERAVLHVSHFDDAAMVEIEDEDATRR